MRSVIARGTCAAAVLAMGTVVFAQSTGQPPTSTTPQTPAAQTAQAAADQVTITGCVQKEADYRAANNMGSGGVAGTGVGAANEYVLVNATVGASAAVGTSGSTPPAAGTPAAAPAAYELTGTNEGQAGQFVGKRVEIVGKLKAAETSATGAPTGGATAGTPPAGVDVTQSKDLKLREIEVSSIRETTGTCPAK